MKKLISIAMCFVLLFSFCTFAVAIGRPNLQLICHCESLSDGTYSCFNLTVKYCNDLENFELLVQYNPDVLQYSENYPITSIAVVRNATKCTVIEPGKLSIIGTNNGYGTLKKEFNPFCFKVIGAGKTDISVELVSFKTAEGEVKNVSFNADIENFSVNDYYVKYDLTGDGIVTSDDARIALRIAVGLDEATTEQCRAVGVAATDDFVAEIARSVLRKAVGL